MLKCSTSNEVLLKNGVKVQVKAGGPVQVSPALNLSFFNSKPKFKEKLPRTHPNAWIKFRVFSTFYQISKCSFLPLKSIIMPLLKLTFEFIQQNGLYKWSFYTTQTWVKHKDKDSIWLSRKCICFGCVIWQQMIRMGPNIVCQKGLLVRECKNGAFEILRFFLWC